MHRVLTVLGIVALAGTAQASTTTTFIYDALGRVINVEARGTGGTGVSNQYAFDAASNRAVVRSSGPFKGPALDHGQVLHRGETILSADARFKLTMQFDGDLVLYDQNSTAIWYTGTTTGNLAAMQTDGNFVVYDVNNNPVWNSGTPNSGGSYLIVQTDGNLVIYPQQGPVVWASGTCCR
ncbi:hypothetical protein [uncultured Sphingomonas sp.]|uniref:hypothetical protein n=1 Tax=uncultured Sphingomonas sp. TaxID=158754 RepID=UPI0015773846